MQDWDDLRFMLAVSRNGTLVGAAKALGVNETTVARRIARAEDRLRARLFERRQGTLVPTEAGRALAERAASLELELEATVRRVSGEDRRAAGLVRVTAVPLIANRILAPALPELLGAHPELAVDLIADPRDLSLTGREADVALRLARPEREASVVARRLATLRYGLYGPEGAASEALPWISYGTGRTGLPHVTWIAERMAEEGPATPRLFVQDAETLIQCLRAGLGKSLLPRSVGDRLPSLKRLDPGPVPPPARELWLLVHPELRELARVRAVVKWLEVCIRRLDTAPIETD